MSACKNCGKKGFNIDRKGYECTNCGYVLTESKELSPISIVKCNECGCLYSAPPGCPTHAEDRQHPAKF